MISDLAIRIIRPDIRYPTERTLIISESDIRIYYLNPYLISRKMSGYPKKYPNHYSTSFGRTVGQEISVQFTPLALMIGIDFPRFI